MKANLPPGWQHHGDAYLAQAWPERFQNAPSEPSRSLDAFDDEDVPNAVPVHPLLPLMRDPTEAEEQDIIRRFCARLRRDRSRNLAVQHDVTDGRGVPAIRQPRQQDVMNNNGIPTANQSRQQGTMDNHGIPLTSQPRLQNVMGDNTIATAGQAPQTDIIANDSTTNKNAATTNLGRPLDVGDHTIEGDTTKKIDAKKKINTVPNMSTKNEKREKANDDSPRVVFNPHLRSKAINVHPVQHKAGSDNRHVSQHPNNYEKPDNKQSSKSRHALKLDLPIRKTKKDNKSKDTSGRVKFDADGIAAFSNTNYGTGSSNGYRSSNHTRGTGSRGERRRDGRGIFRSQGRGGERGEGRSRASHRESGRRDRAHRNEGHRDGGRRDRARHNYGRHDDGRRDRARYNNGRHDDGRRDRRRYGYSGGGSGHRSEVRGDRT